MISPLESDPDFQFLVITAQKKLENQTQPFDAKTSCWIPDHKEGYIKGTITATKGDDVTVTTINNEVIGLHKNHIQPNLNYNYLYLIGLPDMQFDVCLGEIQTMKS